MCMYLQGGLGIREEMCLSFLMYCPRITVDACLSSPAHDAPSDFAIDQMTSYLKRVDHHYDSQMTRLNSLINQVDWENSRVRDKFRNKARMSGFDNQCFYRGKKVFYTFRTIKSMLYLHISFFSRKISCITFVNLCHF
jgi:hypothetical protein